MSTTQLSPEARRVVNLMENLGYAYPQQGDSPETYLTKIADCIEDLSRKCYLTRIVNARLHMKARMQEILERELNRLDKLSSADGLGLSDFKCLDLLIKCHNTFVGPPESPVADHPESPESQPIEDLLVGIESEHS